jgi:hypothetical protein
MTDDIKWLWNKIKGWTHQQAQQYVYEAIPKERTDRDYDDSALREERSYFRLWLCEMFLSNSQTWFTNQYPAVHSSVQLKFGDQDGVNFSRVAQVPQEALAKGLLLNYRLTELMPFNGGTVEIEAALLALQGANYLQTALNVLQDFSGLITPPLGQVLSIAEKVSSGMKTVIGASNNNRVHLALHQTFTSKGGGGAIDLKPGYIAVILATSTQVARERLSIRGDQLYYSATPGTAPRPLTGYDYMLFRLEGREERDDWRLKNIVEPLNKSIEALLLGEDEKASAFRKAAIATAFQSPDLAVFDRRRVVQAIKDELDVVAKEGRGAVGVERGGDEALDQLMQARAMPMNVAAAKGAITAEEAFG